MRRRPLLLLLAAGCGEPPPPPQPPPPIPVRLEASRERLRKLAEEQLAAAPGDAHLAVWAAHLKGQGPPPGAIAAVARASGLADDAAAKAVEEALPGSSHASLFRAHAILRGARGNPAWLRDLGDAIEEALRRKRWDCPAAAFHAWALEWLEKHEPDVAVRVCYRVPRVNTAFTVLQPLARVAEGLARAPVEPKADGRRTADLARRLVEERGLLSPHVPEVLLAHAVHETVLEAQFLTAWKQRQLDAMQSASLGLEEWGRRQAAVLGWAAGWRARRSLGDAVARLEAGGSGQTGADHGELWKEVGAGAKDYWAALRSGGRPVLAEIDAKRPAASPRRNYLGLALRDRRLLFAPPLPPDRHADLLDAAFDGGALDDGQSSGLAAYAWVVRESLLQPGSLPSDRIRKRIGEREGPNLDVYAVLKRRKEDVTALRRPDPAAARKPGEAARLHGYAMLLADLAASKSPEASDWLPEAEGPEPSAVEVMLAETLRGATQKDFALDWPRWRAQLGGN